MSIPGSIAYGTSPGRTVIGFTFFNGPFGRNGYRARFAIPFSRARQARSVTLQTDANGPAIDFDSGLIQYLARQFTLDALEELAFLATDVRGKQNEELLQ